MHAVTNYLIAQDIRSASGFTLVEMLIVMVVMAILLTLAAPSFARYAAQQRLRSASYDLVSALQVARSEAIKRNTNIDMVRTVTSSAWDAGWQVKAASSVLREQSAYSKISITDSANVTTITYGNDGRPSTATTTFKIDPAIAVSGVVSRCVKIALSGVATSTVGGC